VGSKEVYLEDWWSKHRNENRCVAHRKIGERCLKAAIRGANVCRFHGELLGLATGAESEAVKLNAIRDALDRSGLGAKAEVSLEIKPLEQLMGDIAGVATISRAEHRARRGRAFVGTPSLADAIDAEVVEPDDESGPERGPESPGNEMRGPDAGDVEDRRYADR
jgi:hypothetical protein